MKIKSTEILLKTKFLNMNATEYEDTKGKTNYWTWVQRPGVKDIVVIVPFIDRGFVNRKDGSGYQKDLRLIIIKEFRIPIADYIFSFPAGLVDLNENIEDAIQRELKEESGLDIDKIIGYSDSVYNSCGMTDENVRIAFVSVKGEISNKNQEASEDIQTFEMNQEEVTKLINDKDNKFDAKAWLLFRRFALDGSILF